MYADLAPHQQDILCNANTDARLATSRKSTLTFIPKSLCGPPKQEATINNIFGASIMPAKFLYPAKPRPNFQPSSLHPCYWDSKPQAPTYSLNPKLSSLNPKRLVPQPYMRVVRNSLQEYSSTRPCLCWIVLT